MLKVGIIGFGAIAELGHTESYKYVQDVEVVAVSDITPKRLEIAKEKLKLKDNMLFTDYKEMLNEVNLDMVDVCLPPQFHRDAVLEAARHGLHILIEKPLGMTIADTDQISQILKENNVKLGVCHQYLYMPSYTEAKKIIEKENFGNVIYFEFRLFQSSYFIGAKEFSPTWRATGKSSGGGPMFDVALHPCYLANWFVGSDPLFVKGTVDNLNRPEYSTEDFAHAFYRYPNGSLAEIMASWFVSNMSFSSRVECEKATMYVPLGALDQKAQIRVNFDNQSKQYPIMRKKEFEGNPAGDFIFAYSELFNAFTSLINENKQPKYPIKFQDGKKAVEMVLAAYESAALGEEVSLPLKPDDPVYQKGILGLKELDISRNNPILNKNIFKIF